jgi:tetratricopeptide (TPR) repeat protein
MGTVTWVHLSDLHFSTYSDHHGAVNDYNRDLVLDTLLGDLRSFPATHGLDIDFVVITGDIAFSGRTDEYALVKVFLDRVLDALSLAKSHLFLVPGNHDIDRMGLTPFNIDLHDPNKITQFLLDDGAKNLHFRKFNAYRDFVNQYLSGQLSFDYEHRYFWTKTVNIRGVSVSLLGLNSAWNASGGEGTNEIVLGEKQIREALAKVEEPNVTMALTHHPLELLCEVDRPRAERLLRTHCDFILHGHLHTPGFRIEATPDSQTITIPAGASYHGRQRTNSYNYVRFDSTARAGDIWFRRYSDRLMEWIADAETCSNTLKGTYSFELRRPDALPSVIVVEQGDRLKASHIYGRKEEVSEVIACLKAGSMAVVGIKGIGKSKLLSAVFEKALKDPPLPFGALYWTRFDYKSPPSFTDFARRLLKDLTGADVEFRDVEIREQVRSLIKVIDERGCLLVIDQFECVLDGYTRQPKAGFLELLQAAKQTLSKARLLISAWEVPRDQSGLLLPHKLLTGISTPAGLDLVAAALGFTPSPSVLSLMEKVIAKLQGHPLSIELIVGNFSHQELQRMLADVTLWRSGLEDTASKVVSRVVSRIDNADVKQMLAAVCLFGKPCELEAAAHAVDMSLARAFLFLNELTKRSLINCDRDGNYDAHILVRDHVLSQLSDEERARLHERAAAFLLDRLRPSEDRRESIHDVQSVLDAIDHLLLAGKHSEAVDIFRREKIHEYLLCWRHLTELKRMYERFLEIDLDEKVRSAFLGNLGMVHRDLFDYDKAEKLYRQALDVARESGSIENECCHLINLGDLHHFLNQTDTSIEYHQEAVKFFPKVNNTKLESRNYGCLGNALSSKNDLNKARECYIRAIELSRTITDIDRRFEGVWTGDLGNIEMETGRYLEAEECYISAIRIADHWKDARHRSWWRGALGGLYLETGRQERAHDLLNEALMIARESVDNRSIVHQLQRLVKLYQNQQNFPAAVSALQNLADFYQEIEDRKQETRYRWSAGDILFRSGEYRNAIALWEEVLRADTENEDWLQVILHRLSLGERFVELGRNDLAVPHVEAAYAAWRSLRGDQDKIGLLPLIREGFLKAGEGEGAWSFFQDQVRGDVSSLGISLGGEPVRGPEPTGTGEEAESQESRRDKEELNEVERSGVLAYLRENDKIAIEIFHSGIDLSRKRGNWEKEASFRVLLSLVLASSDAFRKAREELGKSIRLAEDHKRTDLAERYRAELCEVYITEIRKLFEKGDSGGAKDLSKAAIQRIPKSTGAQKAFGELFQSLGRHSSDQALFELGVQAFANAVSIDPEDSQAYEGRANCYALCGDLKHAIQDYDAVARLDPSNTGAILSKMEVEIWLGRYSDARGTYWKSKSLLKSERDLVVGAWLICTALALDGMKFHDYLGPLDDPETQLPESEWGINDIEPYFERFRSAGCPEERLHNALDLYNLFKSKIIPLDEIKAKLEKGMAIAQILNEAKSFLERGDFQAALKQCNEAIGLHSTNSVAYFVRGGIYNAMYNHSDRRESLLDQAIADFTEAIEKEPDAAEAYRKRGNCLAYRGRLSEAIADYSKVVQLDPNNASAIVSKMEIMIWIGQYSDARRTLERDQAKMTPMSPQIRLIWAYFYCLSCMAEAVDCADTLALLQDDLIRITKGVYDPKDIENNFLKKKDSIIPDHRRSALEDLHGLFLRHYQTAPKPQSGDGGTRE